MQRPVGHTEVSRWAVEVGGLKRLTALKLAGLAHDVGTVTPGPDVVCVDVKK